MLTAPPVYKPTCANGTPGLELNESSNAPEGDLVAGTYGQNPSYQPDPTDSGGWHDENASYGRRDFQPATLSNAAIASTFLARIAAPRTRAASTPSRGSASGGWAYPGGDTTSPGPAMLPYLFAWGSMMSRTSLAQGITVRGTAIAAAGDNMQFGSSATPYNVGRAKTAGPSYLIPAASNNGTAMTIPGLAPFALQSEFWATLRTAPRPLRL